MNRDTQLIYEAYVVEADEPERKGFGKFATDVVDVVNADDSEEEAKNKVAAEVKKAAEKLNKGATGALSDAEKRKTDDLEKLIKDKGEGLSGLDKFQLALDVTGLASLSPEPVGQITGLVSDGGNVIISLVRGLASTVRGDMDETKRHGLNLVLSAIALVPYAGDAVAAGLKAARSTAQFTKTLSKTSKFTKGGKGAAKGAEKGFAQLSDEIALIGQKAGLAADTAATAGKFTQKGVNLATTASKARKVAIGAKVGKFADEALTGEDEPAVSPQVPVASQPEQPEDKQLKFDLPDRIEQPQPELEPQPQPEPQLEPVKPKRRFPPPEVRKRKRRIPEVPDIPRTVAGTTRGGRWGMPMQQQQQQQQMG